MVYCKHAKLILFNVYLFSLLIISLQLPVEQENVKRASQKLMRLGRTSSHNIMHFGKRTTESSEDADALNNVEISNDVLNDQQKLIYLTLMNNWPNLKNNVQLASLIATEGLNGNDLVDEREESKDSIGTNNVNDYMEIVRRAPLNLFQRYLAKSLYSSGYRSKPNYYYKKKADNRDNVFMHFG